MVHTWHTSVNDWKMLPYRARIKKALRGFFANISDIKKVQLPFESKSFLEHISGTVRARKLGGKTNLEWTAWRTTLPERVIIFFNERLIYAKVRQYFIRPKRRKSIFDRLRNKNPYIDFSGARINQMLNYFFLHFLLKFVMLFYKYLIN